MLARIAELVFLEETGRGQGGVVYRGTYRGQPCSIKLPEERLRVSTGAHHTFERDLLQLARLPSVGLPRVMHLAATPETPFALLELPQGQALSELLNGYLTELEALRLMLQLTLQLVDLHAAGFVHGDLSCNHILLMPGTQRLCLLDTGSVHRPIPFDPGLDTRALFTILQQLSARVGDGNGALTRIVGALSAPDTLDTLAEDLRSALLPLTAASSLGAHPPGARVRGELSLLWRRWEQARQRAGRVMVVLGAPGAGKSRLLQGFGELLRQRGVAVLSIRCNTSDWAPFSAIQRLLDRHLHEVARLPLDRRRQLESRLRAAAGPLASHLRLLSPELARLFSGSERVIQSGDAQAVFIAGLSDFLATYLESTGRSALLIDDVQWLDASSRMVLSRLAERLCPSGHVLVCTARTDEEVSEALDRFDAMLPPGLLERLTLGPLSESEACDVVAELLGLSDVSYDTLVEPLARLSDGTPLSLAELLELAIEQRLLRPRDGHWQLDSAPLSQLLLPASSRALISRRLALLDQATIELLRVAAIVRRYVGADLLARVTGATGADVRAALDRAAGARLLLRTGPEHYDFVHDCVWEALLERLPAAEQRALHQRVADALVHDVQDIQRAAVRPEQEYELARHLAAGLLEQDPSRAYRALARAGKRAITACDDTLALSFLQPAARAAQLAGIELVRDFFLDLAEASLRTGNMKASLEYFQLALARSRHGFEAAHVRGRMAWIYHYDSHASACFEALEAALRECGRSVPTDAPRSLLGAAFDHVTRRTASRVDALSQTELQTLCGLYILCMRVSIENGHPVQGLSAAVHMHAIAEKLEPCRTLVHAELLTATAMAVLSKGLPWRNHLVRAQSLARDLADPIAQTLCHQVHHVIAAWLGDLEQMEHQAHMTVDERSSYMELGELCHLTFGMYAAETLLGKPVAALAWLERAITRVQQSASAPAMFCLIEEAASTALVSLGREQEVPELKRRVVRVQRASLQPGSYFHLLSFQDRVQRLIDAADLGYRFELLVSEWQALQQNPKQAHAIVALYYVHVAHARVHQCLRAETREQKPLLRRLRSALTDMEAAARNSLFKAHVLVTRAAYAFFTGSELDAEQCLAQAQSLAREIGCVWVSFAAARLRAHMLKARGKHAAARDEARIAAQLARRYGPRHRLRAICEEFDLPEYAGDRGVADAETLSVRRHLDALLHIAQASSRELSPQRQARFIVDELIETLAAERGFLFMREAATGLLQCHAARRAAGQDLTASSANYDRGLVEQVYATGQTLIAGGSSNASYAGGHAPERACIVVALVLREHVAGVLYMDRSAAAGSFSSDDVALIEALANQVPVVLELADSLRERERLEQNLRHAQKMEAIGRLAGGIAHDFNNILATIEFAASCLTGHVEESAEEDLSEVRDAARRGAELTRQLLLFSRGKSVPPRHVDLVELLHGLHPLLCRMVRSDVQLELLLPSEPLGLLADPSQLERLLMNLCRNASDAMPQGGKITVLVQRASQGPTQLAHAGEYAELCVIDRGTGMSEEVRARLFEPFFTTKPSQQGTGLGLAIVYAIVQQYAGHIDVQSELGAGSTFRVHLPLCPEPMAAESVSPQSKLPRFVPDVDEGEPLTVLLVDDDDALRRQCERALEGAGYSVLTASDGEEALRAISEAEQLPQLAITDIHMPGMDGLALAERLRDAQPGMRLLFISAEGQDTVEAARLLDATSSFLQKPFDADALLQEVEDLLHGERELSGVISLDREHSSGTADPLDRTDHGGAKQPH